MDDEKRNQTNEEREQEVPARKMQSRRRVLAMMFLTVALSCMMAVSASATSTPAGLANVSAQIPTAIEIVGDVFDMITGNAYLALLMGFGLLAVGVRLFRKAKRGAR